MTILKIENKIPFHRLSEIHRFSKSRETFYRVTIEDEDIFSKSPIIGENNLYVVKKHIFTNDLGSFDFYLLYSKLSEEKYFYVEKSFVYSTYQYFKKENKLMFLSSIDWYFFENEFVNFFSASSYDKYEELKEEESDLAARLFFISIYPAYILEYIYIQNKEYFVVSDCSSINIEKLKQLGVNCLEFDTEEEQQLFIQGFINKNKIINNLKGFY